MDISGISHKNAEKYDEHPECQAANEIFMI